MIRVPIGPRRKKNCEACGNLIETKTYGGGVGGYYSYPYPQIIHLEHADTYISEELIPSPGQGGSRPEIVKEMCQECMETFGKAVEQFFPDWIEPEPVPTYNDYLRWLKQQGY